MLSSGGGFVRSYFDNKKEDGTVSVYVAFPDFITSWEAAKKIYDNRNNLQGENAKYRPALLLISFSNYSVRSARL